MKPHKHAELIKAWAEGAEIQYKSKFDGIWNDAPHPEWAIDYEYRIKEPKPDIEYTYNVRWVLGQSHPWWHESALHNLELTFDGETGKLKSAEVIG